MSSWVSSGVSSGVSSSVSSGVSSLLFSGVSYGVSSQCFPRCPPWCLPGFPRGCPPGYPPWYQEIVGGGHKSTYTIIYIKPCDLVVGELIGELRGYGPLDNVGRASITCRASIAAEPLSLSEHWFALPSDSGADILRWLH